MTDSKKQPGLASRFSQAVNTAPLFQIDSFTLSVQPTGSGGGQINRNPELDRYEKGQVVALTAIAYAGSKFVGWSGDATGSHRVCNLRMNEVKSVIANFESLSDESPTMLSTSFASEKRIGHTNVFIDHGDGTVTDTRSGLMWMRPAIGQIWQNGTCTGAAKLFSLSEAFSFKCNFAGYSDWGLPTIDELKGLIMDAQAFPAQSGRYFWSSSPNTFGTGGRTQIIELRTGTLGYTKEHADPEHLRLVRGGLRYSMIATTSPPNSGFVLCNPDMAVYPVGHVVTLTAQPAIGLKFKCWHGDATGRNATCTVKMDSAKTVSAEFSPVESFDLNLLSIGSGSGVITHSPKADRHIEGSTVHLTAHPVAGSKFKRWLGDATGQDATCSVTMDSIKSISAEFVALESYLLDVTLTGTGRGNINRSIDLPSYFEGTKVTLTAVANEGSIFNGWHGDVSMAESAIIVTMNSAMSLRADFLQLTIADTDIAIKIVSVAREEVKKGQAASVFRFMLRNNSDQQVRIKMPLTSYVSRSGQTIEQSGWVAGLVNGSKGVTLAGGTFCEMGLIHLAQPAVGDRLHAIAEYVQSPMRVCFTFLCIGSWKEFQLISVNLENLANATVSKTNNPTMASALKRIESLENTLAEVLRRLDVIQRGLPMPEGDSPPHQLRHEQTLSEVLAWVAERDQITIAELRLRLLPLDLLPSAVIDDINERAYDLAGDTALDNSGDAVTVHREVLLQVLAAWDE